LSTNETGIVRVTSQHSFADTLERLENVIDAKGLTVFARIDFSGDAERTGLRMKPTKLLIFGNPNAGTPLMIAAPTIALDFPLKALVSEDEEGKVWVSYNSLQYLKERHGVPDDLLENIAGIIPIVNFAAQ